MCLNHQVAALKANLATLPASKVDFASSLIAQHAKGKRPLSEKQAEWVGKLAAMATTVAEAAKPAATLSAFDGVLALFAVATGNGMKKPGIWLETQDRLSVKLSLAPAHGKNAGHVYVKLAGEYAGKISPDGQFFACNIDAEDKAQLIELLSDLSRDPQGFALAYGKATGTCCFCAKDLTDARSVTAGYGPQCAEHWGLPWGEDA